MWESEVTSWLSTYKKASASLHDRSGMLAAAAEIIEKDMVLLGITAVEDRLQDEAPEVIAEIIQAGITFWMLTGDKEETAVNIGFSCKLIENTTNLFYLSKLSTAESFSIRLLEICEEIRNMKEQEGTDITIAITEIALVLDGPSFKFFDVSNEEQKTKLLYICQACRSVIACRLIPAQKQALVTLVKKNPIPKLITLAIGDGANDVSMIREAHVGIGIIGKEGRQAANNSDFAIGQFKFLRRLLFVHGRSNYMRQSKVFLYSIHKNICITFTLFWYR
jgi:phospholipid-transporting ATPase